MLFDPVRHCVLWNESLEISKRLLLRDFENSEEGRKARPHRAVDSRQRYFTLSSFHTNHGSVYGHVWFKRMQAHTLGLMIIPDSFPWGEGFKSRMENRHDGNNFIPSYPSDADMTEEGAAALWNHHGYVLAVELGETTTEQEIFLGQTIMVTKYELPWAKITTSVWKHFEYTCEIAVNFR